MIHDRDMVRERALELAARGKISTLDGNEIALEVDTLCIHGDTPGAWELAATVREALETAGIQVLAMGQSDHGEGVEIKSEARAAIGDTGQGCQVVSP